MSKIGQIRIKSPSKQDPCGICSREQWQMRYYVNHVETGYMEDVQGLKG